MGEQIGQRLGKFVGLDQPVTLVARALQSAELFATRLRWEDSPEGNPTCFARMEGYLVCVQRRSLLANPYWVDDHPVPLEPLRRGQFLLIDVRQQHAALVRGNVDCVSFYVSREALERFREEHDVPRGATLRARSGVAFNDEPVRQLGECMLPAFDRPERASQLFIDHVTLALLSHLTEFYGDRAAAPAPLRGGLAPWQERRAREMLMANLDGRVGLGDLARECQLSRSYFARAFKATVGVPPLQWQQAQRLERAKTLLLESDLPVSDIAFTSGFSDSSHFTRAFTRATGAAPGSWRRARRA
ncbi:MAG: AraC family transcriptional regulator [Alphaproteobacteria bacterium]|nr:AraC family transcriptional regulator [Alphaproteobacteria bacterium]